MRLAWTLIFLCLLICGVNDSSTAAQLAVSRRVEPFPLRDVRLLDGPFMHAQQKDAEYLLSLEPNRLLSWFRKESGLPPKGEVYDGWEIKEVAGHSAGHYLSACSLMWQATGESRFLDRVNFVVEELAECQRANGNGYFAAIPRGKEVFSRIARGQITSEPFYLNEVWIPWYTIHKQLAGLRDAYLFCDNTNALAVAQGLADWMIVTTTNLTDAQWQKMLACEHGGISEALADLYAITGEMKYLGLAKQFCHRAALDPLAAQRDELAGQHANTIIPKLTSSARLYELTGEARFLSASQFFWETVTRHHSYVTGSNSDDEQFGKPNRLNERLSDKTAESCNVHNMLKLTKALFQLNPSAHYADYSERALWNHILASLNPTDGMVCYYLPLRPGTRKKFMSAFNNFTCCNGTGMENHARYGEAIYFHNADELYVNQFIASELNWRAKKLRLQQQTDFPNSGRLRFTIHCDAPVAATLIIRRPGWMTGLPQIELNQVEFKPTRSTTNHMVFQREWRNEDCLEIELPLSVHTEAMPDNPRRLAFLYGPIVLAADLGPATGDRSVPVLRVGDGRSFLDKTPTVTMASIPETRLMPVIVSDNQPGASVKASPERPLTFHTSGVGRPEDLTLQPLYQIHDRRYSVYFDWLTEKTWQARKKDYLAEQERLKKVKP